jgi:hypothetical protein
MMQSRQTTRLGKAEAIKVSLFAHTNVQMAFQRGLIIWPTVGAQSKQSSANNRRCYVV